MVTISYYINAPKAVLPINCYLYYFYYFRDGFLFLKNSSKEVSELTNSNDDKKGEGIVGRSNNLNNNNELLNQFQ